MKRILVTGAAQGIGRAVAELLSADEQNELVVIDKHTTDFIEECKTKYSERFTFYLQDIAERDGLRKVLGEIGRKPVNGIVNNAGEVYLEKWDNLKLKTWDRTLAVNLTGPLQIVHELRDALAEDASIVNIASSDGLKAAFDTVAYAASKAALMNLTKSLAAILGTKGVRVNAIAPGWVETEMVAGTLPEEATYITPLGRHAQPKEIADLIEFLLSEKSSFISGETIGIDGGMTVVDYTIKKESEHFVEEYLNERKNF